MFLTVFSLEYDTIVRAIPIVNMYNCDRYFPPLAIMLYLLLRSKENKSKIEKGRKNVVEFISSKTVFMYWKVIKYISIYFHYISEIFLPVILLLIDIKFFFTSILYRYFKSMKLWQ